MIKDFKSRRAELQNYSLMLELGQKECKPRHHHPEASAKLNQGPPDKGVSTLIENTQQTTDTWADTQVIGLQ